MPRYIIEITRNMLVGLPGDPPIACPITTRSRPYQTREAADAIAAIIRQNCNSEARVICE